MTDDYDDTDLTEDDLDAMAQNGEPVRFVGPSNTVTRTINFPSVVRDVSAVEVIERLQGEAGDALDQLEQWRARAEVAEAEVERLLAAERRIAALLTSGPIGRVSRERYIRADYIRAALDAETP